MAEGNNKISMMDWAHLLVPLVPSAFFALFLVYGYIGKVDNTGVSLASLNQQVSELKIDLANKFNSLQQDIKSIPGYQERVTQLESRQREQIATNGAVDSRIGVLERSQAATEANVDNLVRGSSQHLR